MHLRTAAWILACILSASTALAHPAPFSYLDLNVSDAGVSGTLVVHDLDAAHDLGVANADTLLEPAVAARYRDQLIAQQQIVQQAGGTSNEYWAVSSAVLSASANQAAMLIAMQGQRGTDPKDLKFITATLRVDFEKSAEGQWKVANLIVLKKPQMNVAGQ